MTDARTSRRDEPANGRLVRSIGFWGLTAVVLNGMIGAGVFALPGSVAHVSGSWAPWIIFCVGIALIPVVLVFASLAALFEDTGGPLLYVRTAFGPVGGFQTGWIQCLSTTASSAANANLLTDYVLRLTPWSASSPIAHAMLVSTAIALALAINLLEARRSSAWINRISIAKVIPLALLVLLALPAVGRGGGMLPASEWSLPQAILLSVYAFIGFEGGLCIAGEARDPRRDFPRALVGVFLIVSTLYALIAWGYTSAAYRPGAIDKASLATLATTLAGTVGAVGVVIAAALSIFGNLTVNSLLVSRRLLGLPQIPALPAWFGAIRSDSGLPRNAVVFTIVVTAALALSGGFHRAGGVERRRTDAGLSRLHRRAAGRSGETRPVADPFQHRRRRRRRRDHPWSRHAERVEGMGEPGGGDRRRFCDQPARVTPPVASAELVAG